MTSVWYIAGAVVCAAAGAGICAMILHSRHRRLEDSHRREAEALLDKTKLAASQESSQLRTQLEQALITPACGLVGMDLAQASHVVDLTGNLAQRVEAKALELGLTLGA